MPTAYVIKAGISSFAMFGNFHKSVCFWVRAVQIVPIHKRACLLKIKVGISIEMESKCLWIIVLK